MFLSANLSPGSPEVLQTHLKALRDQNFNWLLGCTFMVGAGLLMELPEIVHDMCEIYGRRSRELGYWLATPIERRTYPTRDWVKKWAALGWLLIVLGLMGEGWFEAQVSKYDSALSQLTDAVVAEARRESASAEVIAKGFDAQIADSNAKAKSAEAMAKQFEAQIASAQKDAAEANKRAAEAALELAELRAETAPRRLSSKQKEVLVERVSAFAIKTIGLGCVEEFGAEIKNFAHDFFEAFSTPRLGFKVNNPICALIPQSSLPVPPIIVRAGVDRQHDASTLLKALLEIGINKNHIRTETTDSKAVLALIIGPRPHGH
jgi:hypothetical protein